MQNFILLAPTAAVNKAGLTLDTIGSLTDEQIGIFSGNTGLGAGGLTIDYNKPLQVVVNRGGKPRVVGPILHKGLKLHLSKGTVPVKPVVTLTVAAAFATLTVDKVISLQVVFTGISLDDPRRVIVVDTTANPSKSVTAIRSELLTSLQNKLMFDRRPAIATIDVANGTITGLDGADVTVTDISKLNSTNAVVTIAYTTARIVGVNTFAQIAAAEIEDASKQGFNGTMAPGDNYTDLRSKLYTNADVFDTLLVEYGHEYTDGLQMDDARTRSAVFFMGVRGTNGTVDNAAILDLYNFFNDFSAMTNVALLAAVAEGAAGTKTATSVISA